MNIELIKSNDFTNSASYSEEFLENILISLDTSKQNKINDLSWQISKLNINFNSIESLKKSHPEWINTIHIDIVIFAKILLLINIKNLISLTLIRYKFDSIVKTLYFLANNNLLTVTRDNYEKYLEFFLLNRIDGNRVVLKLAPLSYHTYSSSITPSDWFKTLKLHQLPLIGFKENFTASFVSNGLKNTIEEVSDGELGFGDWKAGGSFNRLTLDYGRYYVDHCNTIFEKHFALAIALRKTLTESSEIIKSAGVFVNKNNLRSYVMLVIGHYLAGKKTEDFPIKTLNKHSKSWFNSIENSTTKALKNNLTKFKVLETLTSKEYLLDVSEKFKFRLDSQENLDSLKQMVSIIWTWLTNKNDSAIVKLRKEELKCFNNHINNQSINDIINYVESEYKALFKTIKIEMPTPTFFSELGIVEKGPQSKFVKNFIRFVESAGIVKFVSLTGWRESEYGFGLENISCHSNLDILDQMAHPIRYEITWLVPKSNGTTLLKREVTYGAYLTALNLSQIVDSDSSLPCLYSYNINKKNPNDSREPIPYLTSYLWGNFVNTYEPFKKIDLIDELSSLEKIENLNSIELIRLEKLRDTSIEEKWESIVNDFNLRNAKNRSKLEFDRVNFLIEQDNRRGFVWKYKTGILNPEHHALLDKYLSEDTKMIISNFSSEKEISPVFTRGVIDEIIEDCLYPTPHAFRHMWAEAVYRRFDGDVGWMIRSNFKHINAQMWLAYVRDKDNRRQHDKVKREVISSLLNNHIRKKGKDFAGPLDKFLRRLINLTHIAKPDDLTHFIKRFAIDEIEDVKSNPWGFCLLKKRNKSDSKCAEQGIPQRHNASPALCLGCKNNLTQVGNIEGILLGISNDIKVLLTPEVPESFFNESYRTVFNANKQLKKLKADDELLTEIEECLKNAKERLSK